MDWTKLITIKQLRMLKVVSEAGSLTNAASRLNLSPPAITIQLNQLEQFLAVKLVERGPNGRISMSEIGAELLKLGRQIEAQITKSYHQVEQLKVGESGHIKLGAVSTAQYFCPWIIAKAKTTLPNMKIDLIIGNRDEILRSLEDGRVDLAIMGRPPREPLVNSNILGNNPHIIILANNHPLTQNDRRTEKLTNEEIANLLQDETFLVREQGSGTRILLERFLDTIGRGKEFLKKEFTSNETIKQGVMAGLGIALISSSTALNELKDGSLRKLHLHNLPIVRQWFIVNLEDSELNPAIKNFKTFLFENKTGLLP